MIDQSQDPTPFVIGIFYGRSKPSDTNFLQEFVDECLHLEREGININDEHYDFRISRFIADAPARSFLKGCKSHNSYFACERCIQEGEWIGRVVYTNENSLPRTDSDFNISLHSEHHNSKSILSQFPLDYMHLVCLRVMKKLLRE